MKRNIIFICLLALVSFQGHSQSSLKSNVIYLDGLLSVSENGIFDIDLSIPFEASEDYVLQMSLPSSFEWQNPIINTGENNVSLTVGGITSAIDGDNTVYSIPLVSTVSGNSTMVLEGFVNRTTAICTGSINTTIPFELFQNDNRISVSDVKVVTRPKGLLIPSINLYLFQNQEKNEDNTSPNDFPYYVDVNMKTFNNTLSQNPQLTLDYPVDKLTLIKGVLIKHQHYWNSETIFPFHQSILTLGTNEDYIHNESTGQIEIKSISKLGGQDYMRFYFKVNTSLSIVNEVVLKQEGAKYTDCDGDEEDLMTTSVGNSSFPLIASSENLLASFEYDVNEVRSCIDNCDLNLEGKLVSFDFEPNFTYVNSLGSNSVPEIEIFCPYGDIKTHHLKYGGNNLIVEYITATDPNIRKVTTYTNSLYSFGTDNPTHIYIKNYEINDGVDFDKKFQLFYNLTSVTPGNFQLKFSDTYANSKEYVSTSLFIGNQCDKRMHLTERYEAATKTGYVYKAIYQPSTRSSVRLSFSPINANILEDRTVVQLKYTLDGGMIFDTDNMAIRFAQANTINPSNNVFNILEFGSNTNNYKNIKIERDITDPSSIFISMLYESPEDCIETKYLSFIINTYIPEIASYKTDDYVSAHDGGSSLYSDFGRWNIKRSSVDRMSASVFVLCPSSDDEYGFYSSGSKVKLRYEIFNRNQNPVKAFHVEIPKLSLAEDFSGNLSDIITLRIGNEVINFADVFIDGVVIADELNLEMNPNYRFRGNEKMFIDITYTIKPVSMVGTIDANIGFDFISFESIQGFERANVPLAALGTVAIVEENASLCFPTQPCNTCVTSFSPAPNKEYLLGAWVKEGYNKASKTHPIPATYTNIGIGITFNDQALDQSFIFTPKGPIIEGWQRIEASFIVPEGSFNIGIELINDGDNDAYFDDIRIHPFRSNMKSYVYDPSTQRLTAELDENNYTTFYEYDDEGNLIRVKKETQRGIMTIQETRINQSKINE